MSATTVKRNLQVEPAENGRWKIVPRPGVSMSGPMSGWRYGSAAAAARAADHAESVERSECAPQEGE